MTTMNQTVRANIAKQPRATRSWNGYAVMSSPVASGRSNKLIDSGYDGSAKASEIF